MRIALLQINFKVGDITGNTDKILTGYKQAVDDGAELVVTTELGLFGYPPRDLLQLNYYLKEQQVALDRIVTQIGDIGLIVGVAEPNDSDGMPLYNSAYFIHDHTIIHKQRKSLLPNYDVFDEHRYFESFKNNQSIVSYKNRQLALLICEDIWEGEEILNDRKLYKFDPLDQLKEKELDCLIVINASPYYWGKGDHRLTLVSSVAREINAPVCYVNQVGGNDELIFDGRSFALDKNGTCIGVAKPFVEDSVMVAIDNPTRTDYPSDTGNIADLYNPLVMGLRDYLGKTGITKGVVIGLSGGIDSAVTAAIAVDALGADKVLGVAMPSPYSSPGSISDARQLAVNLDIRFDVIAIDLIYEKFSGAVAHLIGWHRPGSVPDDVTEENVQARIRGMILMAISNRLRRIVLSTGNKSELAVGYSTLYGDMIGGLAVLSDVPKTLVYKLADYKNDVIPENTITKPPSAELRPDQKDSDSLPEYPILDDILRRYVERQEEAQMIIDQTGCDEALVKKVIRMVNINEFKRRQMPPGLRVTSKAFGVGRRFPIAAKLEG